MLASDKSYTYDTTDRNGSTNSSLIKSDGNHPGGNKSDVLIGSRLRSSISGDGIANFSEQRNSAEKKDVPLEAWLPPNITSKFSFPISAFSTDYISPSHFIQHYRNRVDSLETMQQELVQLQQVLKQQTTLLVNRDYTTFLTTTSRLNDMYPLISFADKLPHLCLEPLQKFYDSLSTVVHEAQIQEKRKIDAKKKKNIAIQLIHLSQSIKNLKEQCDIFDSCNGVIICKNTSDHDNDNNDHNDDNYNDNNDNDDNYNDNNDNDDNDSSIYSDMSRQFIKVRASLKVIENSKDILDPTMKQLYEKCYHQYEKLLSLFQSKLQEYILYILKGQNGIEKKNEEHILYNLLEAMLLSPPQHGIEKIIREHLVSPICNDLFATLTNAHQISTFYTNLVTKLDKSLGMLLSVSYQLEIENERDVLHYQSMVQSIQDSKLGHEYFKIAKVQFKFLEECIWPEVLHHLSSHDVIKRCFGEYTKNLSQFQQYYMSSVDFLNLFEKTLLIDRFMSFKTNGIEEINLIEKLKSKIMDLRRGMEEFESKWRLKIYFTLLRQDTARDFEEAIEKFQFKTIETAMEAPKDKGTKFKFEVSHKCSSCIKHIFSSQIFVTKLSSEFLSLLLQVVSRYGRWIQSLIDNTNEKMYQIFVSIFSDVQKLQCVIVQILEKHLSCSLPDDEIQKLIQSINRRLPKQMLEEKICSGVVVQTFEQQLKNPLKQLTFRLTSTDTSQPSFYVKNILRPILTLKDYLKQLSEEQDNKNLLLQFENHWKYQIIDSLTELYLATCKSHLITSKQTAQSLQRLKEGDKMDKRNNIVQQIIQQMNTDAVGFENQVKQHLGIDTIKGIEAFASLQ